MKNIMRLILFIGSFIWIITAIATPVDDNVRIDNTQNDVTFCFSDPSTQCDSSDSIPPFTLIQKNRYTLYCTYFNNNICQIYFDTDQETIGIVSVDFSKIPLEISQIQNLRNDYGYVIIMENANINEIKVVKLLKNKGINR